MLRSVQLTAIAVAVAVVSACASGGPARRGPASAGPVRTSSTAAAPEAPLEPVEVQWYGWQIIPLDVVALTGFVLGLVYDEPAAMAAGATLFGVGPPIVHLVNGQTYAAGISAGARILVPAGVGGSVWLTREVLGEVRCGPEGVRCLTDRPRTTVLVATLTSAAVAPLLDALDLAWKTTEVEATPAVLVQPGGAVFSLSGRF